MIEKPTVLVLGAGASIPFGFPSGQQLLTNIVQSTTVPGQNHLGEWMRDCGFGFEEFKSFSKSLRFSGRRSVDAFLENRDDFSNIGKFVIAASLIPNESIHTLFKTGDWYQYLFNALSESGPFENFGANKLTIITFNYDRSLEFYLYLALRNSFQKSPAECEKVLAEIPIIHVHGQLAPLFGSNSRLYEEKLSLDVIKASASQIKIIHEAEVNTPEFKAAHLCLNAAEIICFLGFGYHETNLNRLLKGIDGLGKKRIYCSGFDITHAERVQINSYFKGTNLIWGDRDHGNYQFLRETGALLPFVNRLSQQKFH